MAKYKSFSKLFNSLTVFHTYLENGKVQPFFEYSQNSQGENRVRFTGTHDYHEADKLFLYGDRELAKQIEDAGVVTTRIRLTQQKPKRQVYSSVVGFAPHVPNYIAGRPNSMINARKVDVKTPIISVVYNCSVSGGTNKKYIISAAANLFSAVMMIEAKGIRVNLYHAVVSRKNDQTIAAVIKVKDSGQPIDVFKMCYPMVHPSMLRRHYFRFVEVTEGINSDFVYSYGHPVNDRDNVRKAIDRTNLKDYKSLSFEEIRDMNSADEVVKFIEEKA